MVNRIAWHEVGAPSYPGRKTSFSIKLHGQFLSTRVHEKDAGNRIANPAINTSKRRTNEYFTWLV